MSDYMTLTEHNKSGVYMKEIKLKINKVSGVRKAIYITVFKHLWILQAAEMSTIKTAWILEASEILIQHSNVHNLITWYEFVIISHSKIYGNYLKYSTKVIL